MSSSLEDRLGAFGRHLMLRRPPLVPEFEFWLLGDEVDLEAGCRELTEGETPPYWAFCWGAGQALARFVLDHPEHVRGKRIVDLGTGSGIVALAAAQAGADEVFALDLDPVSQTAAELNAEQNGLTITATATAPPHWDLMLAADVLYETGLREWVLDVATTKAPILLADPGRTGTPRVEFPLLERFEARTFPDVDSPQRSVALYEVPRQSDRALR